VPIPSPASELKLLASRDPNSILAFFHFSSNLTCPSSVLLKICSEFAALQNLVYFGYGGQNAGFDVGDTSRKGKFT
jgi:hypothetical protein